MSKLGNHDVLDRANHTLREFARTHGLKPDEIKSIAKSVGITRHLSRNVVIKASEQNLIDKYINDSTQYRVKSQSSDADARTRNSTHEEDYLSSDDKNISIDDEPPESLESPNEPTESPELYSGLTELDLNDDYSVVEPASTTEAGTSTTRARSEPQESTRDSLRDDPDESTAGGIRHEQVRSLDPALGDDLEMNRARDMLRFLEDVQCDCAPAFTNYFKTLEELSLQVIKKRLYENKPKFRLPRGIRMRRTNIDPQLDYFGTPVTRIWTELDKALKPGPISRFKISPLRILQFCLSFHELHEIKEKIRGDRIKSCLDPFVGTQSLQATVDDTVKLIDACYRFRNEYVAHYGKHLGSKRAREQLEIWGDLKGKINEFL